MYCTRNVTKDLFWVGGNDRRLALFEGVYQIPRGVSYNSYLLLDEKTVLFDTVDTAVSQVFFENIDHVLNGRKLDYLVIQHMEPDHSGTVSALLARHPETVVVTNSQVLVQLKNYFPQIAFDSVQIVDETTEFSTGTHHFRFVMAPMVHWPEVMVTYDETAKILFSADAFGTFGALDGALFADEVDFFRDHLDEARRYYTNIVGKYGVQVQSLLKKAAGLDIQMICPLHGFVWRENLGAYLEKYQLWSSYTPEEQGVVLAYASVYGNTANAVDALACRLRDRGVTTTVYDVSVTPAADILAACFRYSHVVLASPTYNGKCFVKMEDLLHDLANHNFQNRTVALMENGSWTPMAAKSMTDLLSGCKNLTLLDPISMLCTLKDAQSDQLDALADVIAGSVAL